MPPTRATVTITSPPNDGNSLASSNSYLMYLPNDWEVRSLNLDSIRGVAGGGVGARSSCRTRVVSDFEIRSLGGSPGRHVSFDWYCRHPYLLTRPLTRRASLPRIY